ncbi:hypothetical protein PR202_gb25831 [Eleusine coracana subsp. coracana]|uniref:Uncharacterized protein n=1 Tax=Eleusine coracana subsp. coracana TaxID=191504 RepID=A0AAV5FQJ4_ELECO|nr:hypothetical protein QOZ80_4BG0354030 [Eleusine coracana subsp. coracana]GJN36894.1 hypothetical protein PR202_gb25795 [Eleusine coracana subsp. coracana]GJN36927.1 hypothetical protein PR202_gb25831 [Eleusine coracana subsp. coracana]
MAASQESTTTTASRCMPKMARVKHIFEVTGYSLLKGIGVCESIESAPFTVGGYDWYISYCPDGDDGYEDYASIFLVLMTETTTKVRVLYEFRLLNPDTGLSSSVRASSYVFSVECSNTDTADFMRRSELEASFLRDDRLVIECDLTVILGASSVSKSRRTCEIQVPPSDALDNLGKFLESGDGADVTFKVQGEVFYAHKIVLAMRSPVFKAEFLGPMSIQSGKDITQHIEDMQPAVFQALLCFIYNDSLPAMEDLDRVRNG